MAGKQRLLGIALVAAIYAIQWFAFLTQWARFQQSVLGILIVPAILIPGWLASGLILGGLVINRTDGGRHFLMGLIVALFATFCLVAAGLNHLNNLAPTYHGP
jgi:hypothetical protein